MSYQTRSLFHKLRATFIPLSLAAVFLTGCISKPNTSVAEVAQGAYSLDPSHASLIFSVQHMGLSRYTMRFDRFDASINFNPDQPELSSVSAVIDPFSISANHPEKGSEWDEELANDDRFLSAKTFPDISFKSTKIDLTGENTGLIQGELTLLGISKSIPMDVTFHGSNSVPWEPGKDILGFSANGSFNRSEFGMTSLLPNTVGDEVRFQIEAEFIEN